MELELCLYSVGETLDLDPVLELRMRSWAREHYVPVGERDGLWHPVLLDELRRRDREVIEAAAQASRMYAPVPLVDQRSLPHAGHLGPSAPQLVRRLQTLVERERLKQRPAGI